MNTSSLKLLMFRRFIYFSLSIFLIIHFKFMLEIVNGIQLHYLQLLDKNNVLLTSLNSGIVILIVYLIFESIGQYTGGEFLSKKIVVDVAYNIAPYWNNKKGQLCKKLELVYEYNGGNE